MDHSLAIPHRTSPTSAYLTISTGVATLMVVGGTVDAQLIRTADEALYRAKASGRNRIAA